MKKNLIIIILFLIFNNMYSHTTKGKEFWLAYMENLTLSSNGPPQFNVHITSEIATTCTLSIPFTGFSTTMSIAANQVYNYTLPNAIYYPSGDEATVNNGIRIVSNDSIEVKAFHFRLYFTESSVVLPINELGADYLITAQRDLSGNSPSEFVVLATQNNTTIEITPLVATLGLRPIGVPFSVVLQQGQVYQIQSMNDLTGTKVISKDSQKKIAVFGGARQAWVGCNTGSDDHVYDQLFPVTSFGTKYNLIPFGGKTYDMVKILASVNNTSVSLSGGATFTMSQGQYVDYTLTVAQELNANFPVSVTQLAISQGCAGTGTIAFTYKGDPGMISLVPADLSIKKSVFLTPKSVQMATQKVTFPLHRVNMVVKTSGIATAKLDNVSIPSTSFLPVTSGSTYSYVKLVLDTIGVLQHTLSCDSGFNASIYAFDNYNFYGHHLGYHKPLAVKENTTSINIYQENNKFKIFPVPASHIINISGSQNIIMLQIIDVYGKEVMHKNIKGLSEIDLNIIDLSEGLYYIRVYYDNLGLHSEYFKLIKKNN